MSGKHGVLKEGVGRFGAHTPRLTLTGQEAAYLKAFYRLTEVGSTPSVSILSGLFGVRMPSVVEMLSRLERKGLLVRERWRKPKLTRSGLTLAKALMHNHRIVELYFNAKLGMDIGPSCSEADKIDYLLGQEVVYRMCDQLQRPETCMHDRAVEHIGCGK